MSASPEPTPVPDTKHPASSVTIWVNALTIVAALLSTATTLTDNIPPAWLPYILAAYGIVNILLRTITTTPLALGRPNVTRLALVGAAAATIGVGLAAPHKKAAGADGGKVAIVLDGSIATSYIVTIDGNGGATVSPIGKVVWVSPAPGPLPPIPPIPPVPPTPSVLSDRAKAIKAAADAVKGDPSREETAQGIALIYRKLAYLARTPGQVLSPVSLSTGVRQATDAFLATRTGLTPGAWQPVRDALSGQWTVIAYQNGALEDYAKLLDEAADGLEASAPNKQISPAMLQLILQIVQMVLSLLKPS